MLYIVHSSISYHNIRWASCILLLLALIQKLKWSYFRFMTSLMIWILPSSALVLCHIWGSWPKYCSFLLLTSARKRHVGFSSPNIHSLVLCSVQLIYIILLYMSISRMHLVFCCQLLDNLECIFWVVMLQALFHLCTLFLKPCFLILSYASLSFGFRITIGLTVFCISWVIF